MTTYTILSPITCPSDATWKSLELTDNKFAFNNDNTALIIPLTLAEADRYTLEGTVISGCD